MLTALLQGDYAESTIRNTFYSVQQALPFAQSLLYEGEPPEHAAVELADLMSSVRQLINQSHTRSVVHGDHGRKLRNLQDKQLLQDADFPKKMIDYAKAQVTKWQDRLPQKRLFSVCIHFISWIYVVCSVNAVTFFVHKYTISYMCQESCRQTCSCNNHLDLLPVHSIKVCHRNIITHYSLHAITGREAFRRPHTATLHIQSNTVRGCTQVFDENPMVVMKLKLFTKHHQRWVQLSYLFILVNH